MPITYRSLESRRSLTPVAPNTPVPQGVLLASPGAIAPRLAELVRSYREASWYTWRELAPIVGLEIEQLRDLEQGTWLPPDESVRRRVFWKLVGVLNLRWDQVQQAAQEDGVTF